MFDIIVTTPPPPHPLTPLSQEGEIPPLPRFEVTKWLKDGEKIVLSDRNSRDALEVLLVPGHCPDELALYDPLDRRLYVGDIIYRYNAKLCPK